MHSFRTALTQRLEKGTRVTFFLGARMYSLSPGGRLEFGQYEILLTCNATTYSVMIRSAHSTSDTKIVGFPNFAPH
jgi:hypothetical protein